MKFFNDSYETILLSNALFDFRNGYGSLHGSPVETRLVPPSPLLSNRRTVRARSDVFDQVSRDVLARGHIGIHTIHAGSLLPYARTCSAQLRYCCCRVVALVVHVYRDFTQCHCCRTRARNVKTSVHAHIIYLLYRYAIHIFTTQIAVCVI